MPETAENYVSQSIHAVMKRQAWKAWAAGLAVVTIWVLLILTPPIAKANGFHGLAASLYSFFNYLCHQLPDRSFFVVGERFGVCSRCFGVYSGLVAGFLIYPLWRNVGELEPLPKFWLFLSLVPITIDWSLTVFGIWENTDTSRLVTGLILGIACATYIVPAIVEITRNIVYRRRTFVDSGS